MPGFRRSAWSFRNACSSGKPRVTIGAVDGDRAAADDQRLGRRVRAEPFDDRRPGGEQLGECGLAGPGAGGVAGAAAGEAIGLAAGLAVGAVGLAAAGGARRSAGAAVCGARSGPRLGVGLVGGVGVRRRWLIRRSARRPGLRGVERLGRCRRRRLDLWLGAGRNLGSRVWRGWRRQRRSDAAARGRPANMASSSWKRRPPMPGAVGVDGGEPAAGGRESRWVVPGAGRVAEAGDQLGADGLDGLVEERPDVAAALLEASRAGRRRPLRRRGRGGR